MHVTQTVLDGLGIILLLQISYSLNCTYPMPKNVKLVVVIRERKLLQ